MKTVVVIAVLLLLLGCDDSTGPSQIVRDQLVVIDAVTGSISETVDLAIGPNRIAEISSYGDFLYIISHCLIKKINLSSMTVEREMRLYVSGTPMPFSAISENDSLLFVSTSSLSPTLYKITTSDMAIVDSIALSHSSTGIETRPGTDLLYLAFNLEQLCILDTDQMLFTDTLSLPLSFCTDICFSDSGDEIYLFSESSLSAYDSETGDVIRSHTFPGSIYSLEAPSGGKSIFVIWGTFSSGNTLVELDRSTFLVKGTLENCYNSTFIRYIESASRLFLCPTQDHNIQVLDMPGFQPAGEIDVEKFVTEMVVSPTSDRLYCLVYYNSHPDVD